MSRAATKAAGTRRTEPRDVRRKQLILAAIDSISKRGISDTTLSHVTQTAKLSHGVVNYHFDNKEALYDATLEYLAHEHYNLWTRFLAEAGPEPARQLAAIVRADFDRKTCTPKKVSVWYAFWGQAKYRPNYLKIHHKYDKEHFGAIVKICSKLIGDGGYAGIDVKRTARIVEALSDGSWLSLVLNPSSAHRSECLQDCLQALVHLFPQHFPLPEDGANGQDRSPE